jgi:hypothetical protein
VGLAKASSRSYLCLWIEFTTQFIHIKHLIPHQAPSIEVFWLFLQQVPPVCVKQSWPQLLQLLYGA